jgi:hypothetical protein
MQDVGKHAATWIVALFALMAGGCPPPSQEMKVVVH